MTVLRNPGLVVSMMSDAEFLKFSRNTAAHLSMPAFACHFWDHFSAHIPWMTLPQVKKQREILELFLPSSPKENDVNVKEMWLRVWALA